MATDTEVAELIGRVQKLQSGQFSSATNYDLGYEACKRDVLAQIGKQFLTPP